MNITKKQRHEDYKAALSLLKGRSYNTFGCLCLGNVLGERMGTSWFDVTQKEYPEFFLFKNERWPGSSWWSEDNDPAREIAFEFCIEMTR